MRIAVISDTHDHLPAGLPGWLAGADEIWHLGDVCDPRTLVELEILGKPMHLVSGNCDTWPAWPRLRRLERGGHVFHLEHIPPARPAREADVMLHGHTHIPRDETDLLGVRWLNPGSTSEPRHDGPPSFAWLTVDEQRDRALLGWKLQML